MSVMIATAAARFFQDMSGPLLLILQAAFKLLRTR
jgi:hypothetical protein